MVSSSEPVRDMRRRALARAGRDRHLRRTLPPPGDRGRPLSGTCADLTPADVQQRWSLGPDCRTTSETWADSGNSCPGTVEGTYGPLWPETSATHSWSLTVTHTDDTGAVFAGQATMLSTTCVTTCITVCQGSYAVTFTRQ